MDDEEDDLGLGNTPQEPDQSPDAESDAPAFIPAGEFEADEESPEGDPMNAFAQAPPEQAAAPPDFIPANQFHPDPAPDFIPANQFTPDQPQQPQNSQVGNFARGLFRDLVLGGYAVEPLKYLGRLLNDDPHHNGLNTFAQNLQRGIDYITPMSDADKQTIGGIAGSGAGQMLPAVVATLLGGPMGGVIVGGAQMGLGGGEASSEAAERAGATPETVRKAGYAGAGVMGAGGLILGAAAGRVLPEIQAASPALGEFLTSIFKNATREGIIFSSTGEAQEYLNQQVAKQLYDTNATYHADINRILGQFGAGAVIGGGIRAAIGRGSVPPPSDPAADRHAADQNQTPNTSGRTQQAPPSEQVTGVGNEASAPERSERFYQKRRREILDNTPEEVEEGVTQLAPGEVAPDQQAALAGTIEPVARPQENPIQNLNRQPSSTPPMQQRAPLPPPGEAPQGAVGRSLEQVRPETAAAEPTPAAPARGPEPVGQPRPAQDVNLFQEPTAPVRGAWDQVERRAQQQPARPEQVGELFDERGARYDQPTETSERPARPQQRVHEGEIIEPPRFEDVQVSRQHNDNMDWRLMQRDRDNPNWRDEEQFSTIQRGEQRRQAVEPTPWEELGHATELRERGATPSEVDRAIELARAQGMDKIANVFEAAKAKGGRALKGAEVAAQRMLAEWGRQENASRPDVRPEQAAERERGAANAAERPTAVEPARGGASGEREVAAPQPEPVKTKQGFPIKDPDGNVIAYAANLKLARKREHSLRVGRDLMDKYGSEFDMLTRRSANQPSERLDPKAIQDLATRVMDEARTTGWTKYLARQEKGKAHLEAPREALWLDEVSALASGKRKPADFITRDKLLRDKQESSHDLVREQRIEEGNAWADRTTKRRPNFEDVERVTGDGNIHEPDAMPSRRVEDERPFYTNSGKETVEAPKPVRSESLRDAAAHVELDHEINGRPVEAKLVRDVISSDPNVRVHTLDRDGFNKVATDIYGHSRVDAFYDPNQHVIYLRENSGPETILHEAVHAVTSRRINDNPEVRQSIRGVMDFTGDRGLRQRFADAFLNEREFLAWGMSNKPFQEALAKVQVTPEIARRLGLEKPQRTDGFKAFVEMVRKALGLGRDQFSALEAVVKLTDNARTAEPARQFGKRRSAEQTQLHEIDAQVQQVQQQAVDNLRKVRAPILMKVRDMDKIAGAADRLFGGPDKNPFRKIYDAVAQTRQKALDIARSDETLLREGLEHRDMSPADHRHLEELMQLESTYQRYGDRPLGRQGFKTSGPAKAWQDAAHPDLERRWNALSDEAKDYRQKLYDFAETRHDALAVSAARERLAALTGIEDSALARRFMENTHTEPEYKRLGADDREREAALKVIQEAGQITNIKGPYTPFIRTGNYAVPGKYKVVDEQAAARKLNDHEFEFNARADADAFAAKQHGEARVISYHIDQAGERYSKVTTPVMRDGQPVMDPNGNPRTYEREIPYAKGDPNTRQVWKVAVERGYLSTHDTKADAKRAAEVLRDTGDFETVDWQTKKYQPKRDAVALASRLNENWYERNPLYENMSPAQREAVKQLMAENYLQAQAATRVHSSRLHRNNVAGADDNLLRNTMMYSQETANRLAHQEFEPAIQKARDEADAARNIQDNRSDAISRVKNEFDSRLDDMKGGGFGLAAAQMGPVMHRVMSVSYLARLATPGYTIRNLTQPGLVTLPEIGGRHGFGAAGRAMVRAYRDIHAGSILGHGVKDTGRAMIGRNHDPRTFLADIMSSTRLSADDKFAISFIRDKGHIDADAGFDVQQTLRNDENRRINIGQEQSRVRDVAERGLTGADRALEWMEDVSRQMPRAAEVINRAVSAVSAFRLEMKRNGGDRLAAARYADDVVKNTQFVYTDVTKPTWQRNPFARAAFQFKQFGKSTYEFMGRHLGNAISRETDPDVRKASLKSLGGLFVTHTIVAGALGLPWEPVRAILLGAKQAGITTADWDQVEAGVREGLTGFGNLAGLNEKNAAKLSEVMARGLPRLLGIDMSGGLGLNNMMIFGEPLNARGGSQREMDNNLAGWLFNMVAGAPAGLGLQMLRGGRELFHGDYAKAIQHLSPLKVVSDVTRAIDQYQHGTVNASGRQTQPPYSGYEAGLRAVGLPPGREANTSEMQRQVYSGHDAIVNQRRDLTRNYVQAASDEDKAVARQRAFDAGLTGSELAKAVSQERARARRTQEGIITDRHSRPLVERYRRAFGIDEF